MDEEFRRKVLQLVTKCGNNQRAAIRASGLPPTVINNACRGIGPKYPRPETWERLFRALGEEPSDMVREHRATYGDKFSALAEWLRRNPSNYPAFEALAKGFGYKKEGE